MEENQNTLNGIIDFPQVINNTHESCYRCYHILNYVKIMVERGDSKETIIEVIEHLNNSKNLSQCLTSQCA